MFEADSWRVCTATKASVKHERFAIVANASHLTRETSFINRPALLVWETAKEQQQKKEKQWKRQAEAIQKHP